MEEFDASKHFAKLLASGQFKVEKDGRILLIGVGSVLIPALTLAKIHKEIDANTLKKIGEYQAEAALKLHTKFFGVIIEKAISLVGRGIMERTFKFALEVFSLTGLGKFEIEKFDKEKGELVIKNAINPIAYCYLRDFGKSDKPIDSYLEGVLNGSIKHLKLGECKEITCIAKGDDACRFLYKVKK